MPLFVEYDFAQVHWAHFHPEQLMKSIFIDGSVFSALYSDHVCSHSESEKISVSLLTFLPVFFQKCLIFCDRTANTSCFWVT